MASLLRTLAPRLVGAWTTQAAHTFLPGVVISGRSSLELLGADGFLVHRTWYDHPEIPDAVSLLGEEAHSFDARGVVRRFALTVTADGWSLERPQRGEDFGQRMTWLVGLDDETVRGTSQLSYDGVRWQEDLEVVHRRAFAGGHRPPES